MNSNLTPDSGGASSVGDAPLGKYAIIVAGGVGSRVGADLPKQFCELAGRPMLWWTLEAFRREDPSTHLIVAMHPDFIEFWQQAVANWGSKGCAPHVVVPGGATRFQSVANALAALPEGDDWLVAVHDAARPLVPSRVINNGWQAALMHGAAVPVVPVSDSLRRLCSSGSCSVARAEYVAVQTPQVFRSSLLREAYRRADGGSFTDDASVAEAAGFAVALFDGDARNIKVTQPHDLLLAAQLLAGEH